MPRVSNKLIRGISDLEAAKVIGVSPSILRNWRQRGYGPRWFRAGRLCRYRLDWLLNWIEENAVPAGQAHTGEFEATQVPRIETR